MPQAARALRLNEPVGLADRKEQPSMLHLLQQSATLKPKRATIHGPSKAETGAVRQRPVPTDAVTIGVIYGAPGCKPSHCCAASPVLSNPLQMTRCCRR